MTAGRGLAAPPPAGSHLPPDENSCAKCHGDDGLWEGETLRLYVPQKSLAGDVHFLNGVNCHDCHGGDPSSFDVPQAHATEVEKGETRVLPFRSPLKQVWTACGNCHKEAKLALDASAHAKAGAKDKPGQGMPLLCSACHGEKAHGMLPVGDRRSPVFADNLVGLCGNCHKEQRLALVKSVHFKAGARDAQGRKLPLACNKCHVGKAHGILPVGDSHSPVFLDHQVQTCGSCHPEDLGTYRTTVHGEGLYKSGLLVTAVCANCHGAHGIYYAADRRSTLHNSKVASTCGECHRYIEQRLQRSVHGRGTDSGETVSGAELQRKPSCTSCHQGHHLSRPEASVFQQELSNRCGNCHADLSRRYEMSVHGELTQLGYEPAAKCADCHGAHEILAVSAPQSRLAGGANRLATCRQCHPYAVANFVEFDPHANRTDAQNYPLVYWACHGLEYLFYFFFAFFVVHAFLWFLRSFLHTFQQGRHRTLVTGHSALVLSEPSHRILNVVLMISFMGLILTGLPLKYGGQEWARRLARGLGGFDSTSVWHHFFAVLAIVSCVTHVVWGAATVYRLRKATTGWRTILFGPDSPVPSLRDGKDLFHMVRWFLGLGPRPVFERWTYWEKFDYWSVWLAAIVIGTSGLVLWYPNLFCLVLPGRLLNVAKAVHSEIAILAASFLFIFYFFHTHFRPEKFPMDLSALTGLVSEEHFRKFRPAYVERLHQMGRLEQIRRAAPSRKRLRLTLLAGLFAFSLGLFLLALILLANLGK